MRPAMVVFLQLVIWSAFVAKEVVADFVQSVNVTFTAMVVIVMNVRRKPLINWRFFSL
jgi:hypothetical protein